MDYRKLVWLAGTQPADEHIARLNKPLTKCAIRRVRSQINRFTWFPVL